MNETLFESIGTLRYFDNPYKLIVEIDTEIVKYYRSIIPKWIITRPQAYSAHISVVRKEVPTILNAWKKYEGEKIVFYYSNIVYNSEIYYWLNCYSKRLEDIREELGLLRIGEKIPRVQGFDWTFHTTIANCKDLK